MLKKGCHSKVGKFLPVYPDFLLGQISLIFADFFDFKRFQEIKCFQHFPTLEG
jgi:hypothetical protein